MRCHPARWLWGLIPVAMLSWIAVQLERHTIESDLERRSTVALSSAGHDWASVAFDGRDGLLVGHPDIESRRDAAVALVRGVWGVRVVRSTDSDGLVDDAPAAQDALPPRPHRTLEDQVPEAIVSHVEPAPAAQPSSGHSATVSASLDPDIALRQDGLPRSLHATHEVEAWALPTVGSRDVPPPEPFAVAATPSSSVAAADAAAPPDTPSVASSTSPAPPSVLAAPATLAPVPDAPERKPPVEIAAAAPEAADPSSQPAADEKTAAPAPAMTQADLPERKPPPAVDGPAPAAEAPSATIASAPAAKLAEPAPQTQSEPEPEHVAKAPVEAPASNAVVGAIPVLPEHKPAPAQARANLAHVTTSEAGSDTRGQAAATTLPAQRRFETSALPPGNTGADEVCLDDVRGAARRVEVHFARGDAKLDVSGKSLIDGLVATLEGCPAALLRIGGHADATGHPRHNQALSRSRARGVASYMTHKGIDAGRLVAIGYGDKRPVAPNDTQENRARNRRIELTVTARAAPLPPMPVRKQGTRNGLSDR